MKNMINLSKIYFRENLGSMFKSGKSKKKTIAFYVMMSLLVVFSVGYNYYNMANSLDKFGLAKNIVSVGALFSVFVVVMLNLNTTQGYIYKTKDFDIISSMPIKTFDVILAKYTSSYLVATLYTFFMLAPCFVVYFIFCGVTAWSILFCILSPLFFTAFAFLFCCLFSWLVSLISARAKNKNIIRTVLSVLFSVGIVVCIYFANTEALPKLLMGGTPLWFKIVFPIVYFLSVAITETNGLAFLYFVLTSLGYAVLSLLILMIGYKKINSGMLSSSKSKKSNKPLSFKQCSVQNHLLKNEFKMLVNNPVYFMNGIMGSLISITITLVCFAIYKQFPEMDITKTIFSVIVCYSVALCYGVSPTSSVSINMEGTKFLTNKSLPIKFFQIATSKIGFNILLNLPSLIVSSVLFGALFKFGIVLIVLFVLFNFCFLVFASVLGFLLNLKFPKLVYSNESQAAKQSVSLVITMFVDMIIAFAPMIVFFAVFDVETVMTWLFVLATIILIFVATLVLCVIIAKKGEKMFEKIS